MAIQNKKIAVAGIGGVGGYLAGMLLHAYGENVTLVARGQRAKTLREQGLVLHSELNGEIREMPEAVVSAGELPPQDVIFLCVKNYSLEEMCGQIRHALTKDTLVIPVMNGVDAAERARKALGHELVADALIYIVSYINSDGSIVQEGDFARLYFGMKDSAQERQELLKEVEQLLQNADIRGFLAENIEVEVWRKYILNCAYNVASAAYDNSMGQLRDDPAKAGEYEALVDEAYQVARAKHVAVTPAHRQEIIDKFYTYRYDATSSLQRDINAGRPNEIETFSGYLVSEVRRLGISAPVSEKMYGLLKSREHAR